MSTPVWQPLTSSRKHNRDNCSRHTWVQVSLYVYVDLCVTCVFWVWFWVRLGAALVAFSKVAEPQHLAKLAHLLF